MELKPGYKKTEIGVIPEDWEVKPLGSVVIQRPRYGINAAAKEPTGRHPRYLRITDITESGRLSKLEFKEVDHKDSQHYFLDQGDIVIARTGASVGKSFLYDTDIEPMVFAGFLICIKADQSVIDPYYLSQRLQTKSYSDWVLQTSMRSGQPGINSKELSELAILVPQLSEQKLISSFISDIDSLITSLEKLIEKKKLIKQGVMQELLTGKRRLPGFLGEWEAKRLGDLCQIMKGSGLSKSSLNEDGSSYCILYGELFTKYNELIENPISKTEINQGLRSQKGDVLLPGSTTTTGIDLAKASALMTDNVLIGGDINVLRPLAGIYGPYLALQINTLLKHKIAEKTKGITIYHLHGKDLSDIDVRVPSFKEQVQISLVINALENEIAILQSKRKKHLLLKQAMMQELLTGRIRLI